MKLSSILSIVSLRGWVVGFFGSKIVQQSSYGRIEISYVPISLLILIISTLSKIAKGLITGILRFIVPELSVILPLILGPLLLTKTLNNISYKLKYNHKYYYTILTTCIFITIITTIIINIII